MQRKASLNVADSNNSLKERTYYVHTADKTTSNGGYSAYTLLSSPRLLFRGNKL